jgi:putative membrane protein
MKMYFNLFLKGIAMGVANVIPGVSGGTIALITGIYEELIDSLKSFDKKALKYILSFKINKFIDYTNLYFIIAVFGGSIFSVFSIANLFKFLFSNYPLFIWSFFFGLIIASIFFVGKKINKWDKSSVIALVIGITIALSFTNISPASENDNLFFVFFCGIIGISGMMLPGLSGSFILILLGNYELLLVKAVADLNIIILTVFFLGSLFGLLSFSHLLSWLLKKYKDQTLAILTGFITGSLAIIWPWKEVEESIIIGDKEKIIDYQLLIPQELNQENIIAIILMMMGIAIVYAIEKFSITKK